MSPENEIQALTGSWEGKLEIGAISLRVVFHLKIENGAGSGSMDSPDQGAFGIPISEVILGPAKALTLKVQAAAGVFEGKIESRDRIQGDWKQSGRTLPLALSKLAAPPDYARPQDPKPPFPYQAVDVTFKNGGAGITLAGTLTYPKTDKAVQAVVLISGSGPQNRDEEIMGHRPFLVLADSLTRRGIAVLRFDDRGVGGSGGNPATATSLDYSTDVASAVAFLKTQTFFAVSAIGLIGHSEGGLIAPLAADGSTDIGFLVLLAGPGCTGREILLQQTEGIMKAMGTSAEEIAKALRTNTGIYDALLSAPDAKAAESRMRAILAGTGLAADQVERQIAVMTGPWMLFFLRHDPIPALERTRVPVLAINGSLDLQVLPRPNLEAIRRALAKAGHPKNAVKEFPGLNHLFQTAQTGLMDEYSRISETIAPAVLDFIGDWILGLGK